MPYKDLQKTKEARKKYSQTKKGRITGRKVALKFYYKNKKIINISRKEKNTHWHFAKTKNERHQRKLKSYQKYYQNHKDSFSKKVARRKNLGFNKFIENDWNCEIDWHHVNNNDVVPVPRNLHRLCYRGNREEHRKVCNKLVNILYEGELRV